MNTNNSLKRGCHSSVGGLKKECQKKSKVNPLSSSQKCDHLSFKASCVIHTRTCQSGPASEGICLPRYE